MHACIHTYIHTQFVNGYIAYRHMNTPEWGSKQGGSAWNNEASKIQYVKKINAKCRVRKGGQWSRYGQGVESEVRSTEIILVAHICSLHKLHNGHINCMHTSGAVFQFVVSSVWSSQHGLCHHGPADLDSPWFRVVLELEVVQSQPARQKGLFWGPLHFFSTSANITNFERVFETVAATEVRHKPQFLAGTCKAIHHWITVC